MELSSHNSEGFANPYDPVGSWNFTFSGLYPTGKIRTRSENGVLSLMRKRQLTFYREVSAARWG